MLSLWRRPKKTQNKRRERSISARVLFVLVTRAERRKGEKRYVCSGPQHRISFIRCTSPAHNTNQKCLQHVSAGSAIVLITPLPPLFDIEADGGVVGGGRDVKACRTKQPPANAVNTIAQ
ncbi:hypothetical protein Trydic_g23700 [Trypoxylus dichotomus]